MKKIIKSQSNGITLVALVITIIILLILAGITIATLTGENGVLSNAEKAKQKQEIAEYEEIIGLGKTEQNIDINREKSKIQILDEVNEILKEEKKLEQAEITKSYENSENPKLIVKTEEGYIFFVYTDRTTYEGKIGEDIQEGEIELEISLTSEDIKYTLTPSGWTNGEVAVKIEIKKDEYKGYGIQYSYDAETWKDYTNELIEKNNGTTIYSRLTNGLSISEGYVTANITNIDKLSPKEFTPTATSTTNSITVTASATDAETTTTSGNSGIDGYRFSKDGTNWTEYQTSGTYTFEELTQNTSYTIKVEVKDKAGNTTQGSVTKGTGTIDTASGGSYSPTTWTNGNVTVTLPTKSGYTTRYTTNGTAPTKTSTQYTSAFTVSSNCTIYYIYTDGTNIGGAGTLNVTNIDTAKPTIGSATGSTATGNTGTVTVNTIADTGGSGLSGIYISTSNTTPLASATGWLSNTASSYTKTVTANGTYHVWVKDKAGNISAVKSCTVSGIVAKVTGVTLANATVYVGNTVTITKTLTGSTSYKSIAFTSGNTSVATIVSGTGVATGVKVGTSTITCTVTNYDGTTVKGTCTLTVTEKTLAKKITAADYGKSINYSVTVNGTTLNNWKVFYNNGTNVYIILDYYLEAKLVPSSTGLTTDTSTYKYRVGGKSGDGLIKGLTTTSYWSDFAKGVSGSTATGCPTVEMLMASYNAKYKTNLDYTSNIQLNTSDTLYVLPMDEASATAGFWLDKVEGAGDLCTYVYRVSGYGRVGGDCYQISDCSNTVGNSARPVICLPSSLMGTVGTSIQI